MTTTKYDPRKTYRRRLPISNSRIKDVSVTLKPNGNQFEVSDEFTAVKTGERVSSHKSIEPTFDAAVKLAKDLVDSHFEDSFLQAEVDSQCY